MGEDDIPSSPATDPQPDVTGQQGDPQLQGPPPPQTDDKRMGPDAEPDAKGGQDGRSTDQDNPVQGAVGGPQARECVHDTKGVCTIHGEGAKKWWRPSTKMVKGTRRGGVKTMKYEKEFYFECDLGGRGRGKRRQTKLPFRTLKTTPSEDNHDAEDNPESDHSDNVRGDR